MTAVDPVLLGFFCFGAGLCLGAALIVFAAPPGRRDSHSAQVEKWHRRWSVCALLLSAVFCFAMVLIVTLDCK